MFVATGGNLGRLGLGYGGLTVITSQAYCDSSEQHPIALQVFNWNIPSWRGIAQNQCVFSFLTTRYHACGLRY